MAASAEERRLGLVHRVLAARRGLREYAILVTEKRSVFIQQERSRNGFMLRTEIVTGAPGKTSLQPKALSDYARWAIGSMALEPQNFSIAHNTVTGVIIGIGGFFPVYHFNVAYSEDGTNDNVVFYAVPLETYAKVTRERPRETILRDYAESIFRLYREVLSPDIMESAGFEERNPG